MAKYKIEDFNKGNPVNYIFNTKEEAESSFVGMFDNRKIEEATEDDLKQLHSIYLAAPLFNDYEKKQISGVVNWLRALGNTVYSPMEFTVDNAWGISNKDWARKVYEHDISDLAKADVVVCLYNGMNSDTGTAWELGYAHAMGKMIFTVCAKNITDKQSLMVINGSNLVCGITNYKDAWLDFVRNPLSYAMDSDLRLFNVDVGNLPPKEAMEAVNKIREQLDSEDGKIRTNEDGSISMTTKVFVPNGEIEVSVEESVIQGGDFCKFKFAQEIDDQS